MNRKFDVVKLVNTVLFGVLSIFFLLPLIWMLSSASKPENEVWTFPIQWIPKTWYFTHNFKEVWLGQVPFYQFYLNSIKISVVVTLATILCSSMAGYAFAKLKFSGKGWLFGILLSFMMIPEQATLVPRYLMIKYMGLYDTHWAIYLLLMFSTYFTFLIRQFMMSIHNDFLEAAELDGAGYFRTFWQIVLPLCKPILATVGIIKFIWSWNDYQTPLIFLYTKSLFPIPLGMQYFKEEFGTSVSILMMASLSAIVPLLILFLVLQRHVIKGISLGGVKG